MVYRCQDKSVPIPVNKQISAHVRAAEAKNAEQVDAEYGERRSRAEAAFQLDDSGL